MKLIWKISIRALFIVNSFLYVLTVGVTGEDPGPLGVYALRTVME